MAKKSPENDSIATKLNQLILALELNKGEFAEEMGLSPATVSELTSGSAQRDSLPKYYFKLLQLRFGVNPDWLAGKSEVAFEPNTQHLRLPVVNSEREFLIREYEAIERSLKNVLAGIKKGQSRFISPEILELFQEKSPVKALSAGLNHVKAAIHYLASAESAAFKVDNFNEYSNYKTMISLHRYCLPLYKSEFNLNSLREWETVDQVAERWCILWNSIDITPWAFFSGLDLDIRIFTAIIQSGQVVPAYISSVFEHGIDLNEHWLQGKPDAEMYEKPAGSERQSGNASDLIEQLLNRDFIEIARVKFDTLFDTESGNFRKISRQQTGFDYVWYDAPNLVLPVLIETYVDRDDILRAMLKFQVMVLDQRVEKIVPIIVNESFSSSDANVARTYGIELIQMQDWQLDFVV